MEPEYKIIDVTKPQMSTDIEDQLFKVNPRPGDVLALKCLCPEGDCFLPFMVLFSPGTKRNGYYKMVLDIVKWLEIDSKVGSESKEPVEIRDVDCLNYDILKGRLTAKEAFNAYMTKELPDHYNGLLLDPEDNEGEEWKADIAKYPSFTEWCSIKTEQKRFCSLSPNKLLSENITAAIISKIESTTLGIKAVPANGTDFSPKRITCSIDIPKTFLAEVFEDEGDDEDEAPINLLESDIHYYDMERRSGLQSDGSIVETEIPVCLVLPGLKKN